MIKNIFLKPASSIIPISKTLRSNLSKVKGRQECWLSLLLVKTLLKLGARAYDSEIRNIAIEKEEETQEP